jgi:hypothetical protein
VIASVSWTVVGDDVAVGEIYQRGFGWPERCVVNRGNASMTGPADCVDSSAPKAFRQLPRE